MSQTILVVDDDVELRLTLASILEDEGYEVQMAGDGLEALDALAQFTVPPAAIMLDLSMPRMDGFAFAAELARQGLRSAMPIIVLTADGHAPEKAARLGADGHVTKPFAIERLLAEVARVVNAPGTSAGNDR